MTFFNIGSFELLSIRRMGDQDPFVLHPWFDHRLSVYGHVFFSHRPSEAMILGTLKLQTFLGKLKKASGIEVHFDEANMFSDIRYRG